MDIDLETWEATYKPITNTISDNASWQNEQGEGILFETYGEELEFVMSKDSHYIWTYIDTDLGTAVCAGYHLVNRIGYFVTEVPWSGDQNSDEHICITVTDNEEDGEFLDD